LVKVFSIVVVGSIFAVSGAVQAEASSNRNQGSSAASVGFQAGKASWYGPGFHGRRTASGEIFNANAMTAAHKTLPFGTMVQVTSNATGRSVVVRINDRGPFVRGRIIDLSKASARALGVAGLSQVSLALR
jgi:rare lipoprotein A